MKRAPALVLLSSLAAAMPAAAVDLEGVDLEVLATGLDSPVAVTHAGDERLFVTLQGGQVVIFDGGRVLPRPFLDLRDRVRAGGERGLLSVAFHPDYAANGFFFVNYTDRSGDTVIARFARSADPDVADPASQAVLLEIDQPFANHNGGQLEFGPDGFLYAGTGDGGSVNDPRCQAQDSSSLLGKLLRLDVDANAGAPPFHAVPASNPFVGDPRVADEIWALGLRNPWRFSFDRDTGDLWIADVGQNAVEEVDLQPAASAGGENYGWKMMEGTRCTNNRGGCGFAIPGCAAPEYTPPVVEYAHAGGRCSITGGYVYRGDAVRQVAGAYFYGDFCTGEVWAAEPRAGGWEVAALEPRVPGLTSFGEDAAGELYLVAGDTLYRLTGPAGGGCPRPPGHPLFCSECGPCGEGEGGCRGDDECREPLACAENFGALFDLPRTADVCVTPRSLPPPAFAASEPPAVGTLTVIEARAVNNAGQVVGHAASPEAGDGRTVAFRFSARDGLEEIDPRGNQSSRGLLINDAGDVFGVLSTPDGRRQNGVFLARGDGGVDLLSRRSNGLVRQTFAAVALNAAGDVAGSIRGRGGIAVPYLYVAGEGAGWHDLSALDPRFAGEPAVPVALNDAGDVVLVVTPRGSTDREAYLLRGGEVIALGDLGGGSTLPQALDDSGRVVGASLTEAGAAHAFVTRLPGRLLDVHPPRFASSVALGVTVKGIVGGRIASGGLADTLFTWDPRRTREMRLQAREPDFIELLIERFRLFLFLDRVVVNERLEFAGELLYATFLGAFQEGTFLFGAPYGLLDVEVLAAAAGVEGRVTEVIDLNDWGALLLRLDRDGAAAAVLLTPVDD